MDRLTKILTIINDRLTALDYMQGTKAFCLSEKVTREDKQLYFEKRANEVQKPVFVDDSFPATIFHVIRQFSVATDNEKGFSNKPQVIETFSMSLFVYLRNNFGLNTSLNVLSNIKKVFPYGFKRKESEELKIRRGWIRIADESIEKHTIWQDVFRNIKEKLSDESILLKIDYDISLEVGNCETIITCSNN